MALTKARPPLTAISQMLFGATVIDIPNTGGPIDIDVAAQDVVDLTTTTAIFDDAITVTANNLEGEEYALSTSGGAAGDVKTTATSMEVGTTSIHPLQLIANSISGLIVGTDGRVTLDTTGNSTGHLVDKDYVDTQITGVANSFTATVAAEGALAIPVSTGDDLLFKWGLDTGSGDRTISFAGAFPNAIFFVTGTPTNTGAANSDGWYGVDSVTTSGFTWNAANRGSYSGDVYWFALGF